MVEELQSYTSTDIEDLELLMHVLSETTYCNETILRGALDDVNTHVYTIRDNDHIVATATLCVMNTLEFKLAHVESVVVLPEYRGRNYGVELMRTIVAEAKRIGVKFLQLTSNPRRVAANYLYQKMGFIHYETNCYKLTI